MMQFVNSNLHDEPINAFKFTGETGKAKCQPAIRDSVPK